MRETCSGIVLASCLLGWAGCGSVTNTSSPDAASPTPDSGAAAISYDVAYISKLTLTPNIQAVHQLIALVNRGSNALPLSSVMVKDVADDNTSVDWAFTELAGSTVMLKTGRAAGNLSPVAQDQLVTTGLVSEPFDDQLLGFEMRFPSPPPVGLVLRGQVVIDISGADVTLVFTIQVTDTGDLVFENPKRIGTQS